jgi:hypothetical protein
VSYNASVVKIYNASVVKLYNSTSILACLKNYFFLLHRNDLAYNNAGWLSVAEAVFNEAVRLVVEKLVIQLVNLMQLANGGLAQSGKKYACKRKFSVTYGVVKLHFICIFVA